MKKIWNRLLTFFIGFPLVMVVVFLPCFNYLLFNLVLTVFCCLGSIEFCKIVESKGDKFFPKPLMAIFVTIMPLSTYFLNFFEIDTNYVLWILVFESIILMAIEALSAKTFEYSAKKLGLGFLCLFYTGYLGTFLNKMCAWEHSAFYIALFLVLVFMCDSSAWCTGLLFGQHSRGYIAASPNKSIVGFIGGILGSILFGTVMWLLFPKIFCFSGIKIVIISILTGFTAIIGDLIESVLKRSYEVKDSGTLIPGRGGILDSIDSIIISAPVFYILVYLLVNN